MLTYYPPLRINQTKQLAIDDAYQMQVDISGDQRGLPMVVVHGGPGLGICEHQRRYFDPERFHIIQYEQRGCGRVSWASQLENNSTEVLINDLEALRQHLDLDKIALCGGGWGASLALAYAQRYPQQVSGLVLWSVQLFLNEHDQWLFEHGAPQVFPDYWRHFLQATGTEHGEDILSKFAQQLEQADELSRVALAKAWASWFVHCATVYPKADLARFFSQPSLALNFARIACHYYRHKGFFEADQLLANATAIEQIPGYLIHGRFNMIAPLEAAWALHEHWPASELSIIRDAGHSDVEPGLIDGIIRAAKSLARHSLS